MARKRDFSESRSAAGTEITLRAELVKSFRSNPERSSCEINRPGDRNIPRMKKPPIWESTKVPVKGPQTGIKPSTRYREIEAPDCR